MRGDLAHFNQFVRQQWQGGRVAADEFEQRVKYRRDTVFRAQFFQEIPGVCVQDIADVFQDLRQLATVRIFSQPAARPPRASAISTCHAKRA